MDGQNHQNIDYPAQNTMKSNTNAAGKSKATATNSASKEPIQKATPGPKHAAAPQLPVIQ